MWACSVTHTPSTRCLHSKSSRVLCDMCPHPHAKSNSPPIGHSHSCQISLHSNLIPILTSKSESPLLSWDAGYFIPGKKRRMKKIESSFSPPLPPRQPRGYKVNRTFAAELADWSLEGRLPPCQGKAYPSPARWAPFCKYVSSELGQ